PGRDAAGYHAPDRATLPAGYLARPPPRGGGHRVRDRPRRGTAGDSGPPGQRRGRDDLARPPASPRPIPGRAAPRRTAGPALAGPTRALVGELRPRGRRRLADAARARGAHPRRHRPGLPPPQGGTRLAP